MAMRAALFAVALATPAAAQAPTSAPTIAPFSTQLSAALTTGATTASVTDVDGCLPDGTITITPTSGTAMSRTILTCTGGSGVTGTVDFTPAADADLATASPVTFQVPGDATISTAASNAGATTVTVSDTSTCQVDGTINFGSQNPETARVTSCGTRRLEEESGEMFAVRRLQTNPVTFSPALQTTQPAGTAITFSAAPSPPSCFAMETTVRVEGLRGRNSCSDRLSGRSRCRSIYRVAVGWAAAQSGQLP
eukprot:TRINITY_DN30954_c0_g1_i2.p1 TRINITY_DN30954_c0_g1~~TRINITY_DN30954_c0_g1_i2.p1  ORF type:complete len:251 (+),score=38.92 TRINITY_DN30954_c0_g1_i2:497-1249(+)